MRYRKSIISLVVLGLVGACTPAASTRVRAGAPTSLASTPASAPSGPATTDQQVAFRRQFGLPATPDALAAAAAHPATRKTVDYGIPLTQAEQDDLEARGRVQVGADKLAAAVDANKDQTGGFYIDQQAHGQLVVKALSGLSAGDRAALVALAPAGGSLRFDPATVSTRQLNAAEASLARAYAPTDPAGLPPAAVDLTQLKATLVAEGVTVVSFAIDIPNNSIQFGLVNPPTNALTLVRSAWDKYGAAILPSVAVEVTSTVVPSVKDARWSQPGQVMTGVDIGDVIHQNACTSNIYGTDSLGRLNMITAGHCSPGVSGNPTGLGDPMEVGCANGAAQNYAPPAACPMGLAYTVGSVQANTYNPNLPVVSDSESILLGYGGYATPYLYSQTSGGIPDAWPVPSASSPPGGGQVCLDGGHSYFTVCGVIATTTWTGVLNNDALNVGVWEYNQNTANITALGGDSGGPLSWGGVDYGILSGGGNGISIFTSITTALNFLGLTPLKAAANGVADWALQVSRYSGMCVDVQWNSSANGTPIWQYPCNGNPAQQWTLVPYFSSSGGYMVYSIHRGANPSDCLDLNISVGNGGMNAGTPVQEWQCNGWSNQQWILRAEDNGQNYEIVSLHSGNCLDLNIASAGGGYSAGTYLQTWPCLGAGQWNQHWRIG